MNEDKQQLGSRQLRLVTYLSLFANTFILVPVKFVVGFLTGSLSLVADGIHSISDMITDFAVLLGLYFGSKEPDSSHPYGHGKDAGHLWRSWLRHFKPAALGRG